MNVNAVFGDSDAEFDKLFHTAAHMLNPTRSDFVASSHKVLWSEIGIGQLRCLKRAESRLSFWVECWLQEPHCLVRWNGAKKRGPFYYNVCSHKYLTNTTWLDFLYRRSKQIAEILEIETARGEKIYENKFTGLTDSRLKRIAIALDYLYLAQSRYAG